ncbi:P-loop containing nucleoside triphosphate hydrolase protein [Gigaspora rosea]|uniref:P-loop containing nucleoside triphosphate hydrolase protein n=1 Tax=Gigaspora rosea TaxID=44941 RepID=A0A397UIT8_9GLOM|nr:P-loop containing nucleoside triphosphate hydrolase protein [Gigaspora rosea]
MDVMLNLQSMNITIKDAPDVKPLIIQGGEIRFEDIDTNNSIYHNILYGKINTDPSKVEYAAKRAQIHDIIQALPDKYNTHDGEYGFMILGSDKQCVVLARTILKDPNTFFDDATSALDTYTEQSIPANIRSILQEKSKTSIFVAHKLRSILDVEKVVLMEICGNV